MATEEAKAENRERKEAISNRVSLRNEFIAMYEEMHRNPRYFLGNSVRFFVDDIAALIEKYGAKTLLDFGCGKGIQYLGGRVHEGWGGILPHCYDPAVRGLHKMPTRRFDGVICTDVLEHVPEDLIPDTVADICNRAEKFVFINVALSPSGKNLPDGRNAHVTLKGKRWWDRQVYPFRNRIDVVMKFSESQDE